MATLPVSPFPEQPARELPDYMPARMVNEFAYCPRLFFYEWVEGLFQESADTVGRAGQRPATRDADDQREAHYEPCAGRSTALQRHPGT